MAIFTENKKKPSVLAEGCRNQEQLFSPSMISYPSEHELKINDNYVRSFVINAYPSSTTTGWLNKLYTYNRDIDISLHLEPEDDRTAIDELTDKITQFETQRLNEIESGSIKNLTALDSKIKSLYQQRKSLEDNWENLFHVSTFCSLYEKDLNTLNKESQKLVASIGGKKIGLMPLFLRHDEGYLATSPFASNPIINYARNMNTGAVTTMFPFDNPEGTHKRGTFLGQNPTRKTPIFVDFFNRAVLDNANIFISGVPGSGKSYLVSLLCLRSLIEGIKTVIIDPEGEYKRITENVNGVVLKMTASSDNSLVLNPFDIDIEVEVDDDGVPTGREFVNLRAKASELLNLFGVMFPSMMTEVLKADISDCLMKLYDDFGFTSSPSSLYEEKAILDEDTGTYRHDHILKTMPRMSDFRNKMIELNKEKQSSYINDFIHALSLYCKGGIYDLFDQYTQVHIDKETPITCFDVSGIEDDMLRPVAMQVAVSWTWNKFIKNDLTIKKRIVCDEAWLMLKKSMAGSDYTSLFLEKCARRIRKYNGSLCVASQYFRECISREEGLAILSSSSVKVFMRQEPQDIGAVSDRFSLNDGEKQFVLRASRGEGLLKFGQSSILCNVVAFPFEHDLITKKYLVDDAASA